MYAINIKPFEIIDSWQQHLNEKNLSEVLKLYDKSCVLVPTFSSEILTDYEKIKEYFVKVIEVQSSKVEFQSNSISEQQVGDNIFLLNGKYLFNLMEDKKIPARFSFLIKILSKNPIIHHHSSRSISN